jgi:hypothetical protein
MAPRTDYGAVIADPPWPYRNKGVNGAAAKAGTHGAMNFQTRKGARRRRV